MRSTSGRIGGGIVLVSLLVGACLSEREKDDAAGAEALAQPEAVFRDARDANEVVLAVRTQLERAFGKANVQLPGTRAPGLTLGNFNVVGSKVAPHVELLSAGGVLGEVPGARAEIALPVRADGAFRLRDEQSGMTIDVGLAGATASAREESNGYVVYRSGYVNGAHIVHRPTSQGTEDYVFFPEKLPETPELRYDLGLGEGVAGLRLVDRTLEMLDAKGAPRLRMTQPYAVDGDGRRLAINVAIEGCAYDASGVAPWGRPTVDPGAKHCSVRLSWDASAKAPLVVDPEWILSTNMNHARMNATATQMQNGRVFVFGGDTGEGSSALDAPEIYDPETNSWATTTPAMKPRANHQAVLTPDGVVVISGRTSPSVMRYNPQNASWSQLPQLSTARSRFTATFIPTKGILVTGGFDVNSGNAVTNSTQFLAATPNAQWDGGGEMAHKRAGHTATLLKNGLVLVTGGFGGDDLESPTTAELFDVSAMAPDSPWSSAGNMASAHANHAAARLADGRVVVMGGIFPMTQFSKNVDIFDPATKQWTAGPPMMTGRAYFAAAMPQGLDGIVVMGGQVQGANLPEPSNLVEAFAPGNNAWKALPNMSSARAYFAAEALSNGRILAIGGVIPADNTPGTSELLACTSDEDCSAETYCAKDQSCKPRKPNGETCDLRPAEADGTDCFAKECHVCNSGNCVDGFCCDTPCSGQCESCNGSAVGAQAGLCAPVVGVPVTDTLSQRDACKGDGLCGGACNGINRESCTYPEGNNCRSSCEEGKFQALACDGQGSCAAVAFEQACSPYACDEAGKQCMTTCTQTTDNTTKSGCDDETSVCNVDGQCISRPTKCIDDNSMELADGSVQSCGAFRCQKGACLSVCDTAYDCATDPAGKVTYVCDESRKCVEAQFENTVESVTGCSASQSPNSSRLGWLAALAIAGAFAARRQRARA